MMTRDRPIYRLMIAQAFVMRLTAETIAATICEHRRAGRPPSSRRRPGSSRRCPTGRVGGQRYESRPYQPRDYRTGSSILLPVLFVTPAVLRVRFSYA